jgi:site-specific recombinase XerD
MTSGVMDRFVDWIVARGAAAGTIRVRRSHLLRFAAHCDPLTARDEDIVAFLAARRDLKPESRKSFLSTLRTFYGWALAAGLVDRDPTQTLGSIRVPPAAPRPIHDEALHAAFRAADEETTLMLLLGCYAGLRRAEIAAVHEHDVDGRVLVVVGKGGRRRRVPVHPLLVDRLSAVRGWAFPSPVRPGLHVSPDYVSSRLGRVLPAPHTPHSLRHYFGTHAYRGSRDLRAVQQLLGHSTPETTARYTLIDEDALMAAVRAVA